MSFPYTSPAATVPGQVGPDNLKTVLFSIKITVDFEIQDICKDRMDSRSIKAVTSLLNYGGTIVKEQPGELFSQEAI
jgi:hypothetical protein